VKINEAMPFTRGKSLETGVMLSTGSVQTFVLTTQPKTSTPPKPPNETRKRESPTISASQSSLTLGVASLSRGTCAWLERLELIALVGRHHKYENRSPKESSFCRCRTRAAHPHAVLVARRFPNLPYRRFPNRQRTKTLAPLELFPVSRIWKSAIQPTWKSALRRGGALVRLYMSRRKLNCALGRTVFMVGPPMAE